MEQIEIIINRLERRKIACLKKCLIHETLGLSDKEWKELKKIINKEFDMIRLEIRIKQWRVQNK